jgi:transposase-like protein
MRSMKNDEPKGKRPRRAFTAAFKAGAVRLVLHEGKSMAQVARDLDLKATPSDSASRRHEPIVPRARPASPRPARRAGEAPQGKLSYGWNERI